MGNGGNRSAAGVVARTANGGQRTQQATARASVHPLHAALRDLAAGKAAYNANDGHYHVVGQDGTPSSRVAAWSKEAETAFHNPAEAHDVLTRIASTRANGKPSLPRAASDGALAYHRANRPAGSSLHSVAPGLYRISGTVDGRAASRLVSGQELEQAYRAGTRSARQGLNQARHTARNETRAREIAAGVGRGHGHGGAGHGGAGHGGHGGHGSLQHGFHLGANLVERLLRTAGV